MSTSAVPARGEPSLTERYIYAVTRWLPEDQRTHVGDELPGTISERIGTLVADRPDADRTANERLALEELLDPNLWSFWLPLILLLLVAEAAFEVVMYRIGRWTFALATINVALGALFAAPVVYLAATDRLLNRAAVAEIQKGWAGFDAAPSTRGS